MQPDRWIENQKERVGTPGQEKGARRREEPRVPNARKTATEFSFPTRKVPLALFVVMLPKAHLTSHSRISGSR